MRQTDPERGSSPWRRGVFADHLVLICPDCQESDDWTAELERCARCGSVHLIRRLDQVDCLDCGLVREPAMVGGASPSSSGSSSRPGKTSADNALAEEVGRALDRVLGRR
ncbi:MAG: hypothetical protein ACRDPY_24675 [Streptosporangiaceae bacterium]